MNLVQFERFIESIKTFHNRECQLGDAIESFNSSYTIIDFCPEIINAILKYLKEYFNDNDEWISYFIYELDYGSKYEPDTCKNVDGTDILLDTIENLYNFVVLNKKENDK